MKTEASLAALIKSRILDIFGRCAECKSLGLAAQRILERQINALSQTAGRFWDSRDQRNTVRTRVRYEFTKRLWGGIGGEYGSWLPFEFSGDEALALAQYGPAVVDRVNFNKGRVRPSLSINASLGADLWKTEKLNVRMQFDATNLNNRLNVIDFASLFSGNAIGPSRSYNVRLQTNF